MKGRRLTAAERREIGAVAEKMLAVGTMPVFVRVNRRTVALLQGNGVPGDAAHDPQWLDRELGLTWAFAPVFPALDSIEGVRA